MLDESKDTDGAEMACKMFLLIERAFALSK